MSSADVSSFEVVETPGHDTSDGEGREYKDGGDVEVQPNVVNNKQVNTGIS